MILTLIGYRGTGKSSIARAVARPLALQVEDSDHHIQRRAGCTIAEIFQPRGERAFRDLERAVIVDLLQRDGTVLAIGGGAILNADTRTDIQAAGPVVWLRASVDTIARRLAADAASRTDRPNLTPSGGRAEIVTVLAEREALYRECASIIVDTDDRSIKELANQVADEVAAAITVKAREMAVAVIREEMAKIARGDQSAGEEHRAP
jgi:shikimate kinase